MSIVPGQLRIAMDLLGITQGELARASQVSPTTISLFLAGQRSLSRDNAIHLMMGLEKAFKQKGARFDTSFFTAGAHSRRGPGRVFTTD